MPERANYEQLNILSDWDALPSPKIGRADRVGPYAWSRLYTGFSEAFAVGATQLLTNPDATTFLDPFAGAGTALIAAARLGHRVIGTDLDPVSALFARAALAVAFDRERTRDLIGGAPSSDTWSGSADSCSMFAHADLAFAQGVFERIQEAVGIEGYALFSELLNARAWDSEVVALAALLASANDSAAVVRGSNPVWFRKARKGEEVPQHPLADSTSAWLARIERDVLGLNIQEVEATIYCGDFRQAPVEEDTVSTVLTSPPYLNRVDYVQSHLAPLHLLSGLFGVELEPLRKQMMGTAKMVDKPEPLAEWGPTCIDTLERIRSHPSKASASYYFPFFCQYFRDTAELIAFLKRVCMPGAEGAIVIQNSFYKEIPIPLVRIWSEMVASMDLTATEVRGEPVRQHLGTLSPSQKSWVKEKTLRESVILLEF